jgi:DNA-directed RNA polymerase specialized sigma subunit
MLKDIPYSELKQDERAYEIMLLRDQHENTFTDIAKECGISVTRVVQMYHKLKFKQIRLYVNHIAVVLGYESTSQVKKVFNDADECYQDRTYACAYLEKKYKDILTEYRDGEPGMPAQFIKSMPPFKSKLSEKTIARVIELREVEKASFVTIAKKLRITQAKAKRTYEMFYHKQVLELIKALQEKAESKEEKAAIWEYYFRGNNSAKKRYDMLTKG